MSRGARRSFVIFLAALTVRLLYLWQIHRSPFFSTLMGDARAYDAWAQRLAAGDWIGRDVFYQAPLYPYSLGVLYAIAGRSLIAVRVCQAVLGSIACVLLGAATERLFNPRAGFVAGLMLALYAPAMFFDGLLQKTTLDVFLICVVLWLLSRVVAATRSHQPSVARADGTGARRLQPSVARADVTGARRPQPSETVRDLFLLGLAMGALALTRENAMILVAVVGLWIVVQRIAIADRARLAAVFVAGLAIVLTPVVVRNRIVGGGFYLTTSQFGPNFYMGNNPQTDGTASPLRAGRGSPEFERQDATDIAERTTGRHLSPGEVSSFWTDKALAFIDEQPGAWIRLMLRKAALLWNRTEWLDTESQESYEEYSSLLRALAVIGHFGVLVPLASLGLALTWRQRRTLWIFYAMIAAYAASVVIFYIYARYRFPLVPFLILFAAAGAVEAIALATAPSDRRPAPRAAMLIAAGVAAVAVFVNWPLLPVDLMRAITENNLGAALMEDGRADEALAHHQKAIDIRSDYGPAHNNLGVALAARGQDREAIAAYRRAALLQPDSPDPEYNIANAMMRIGTRGEAIGHFERALALDPGLPDVHTNLAIALAADGRMDEAIAQYREAVRADPSAAKTHRNLANALADRGADDEAIEEMRRASALSPSDAGIHYDLGSLLLDAQRYEPAVAEFQQAVGLAPNTFEAHNNLGIALASLGRMDEAISEFERALAIRPHDESAGKNLAMARTARQRRR